MKMPPLWRAIRSLISAEYTPPICKNPVGLGAYRVIAAFSGIVRGFDVAKKSAAAFGVMSGNKRSAIFCDSVGIEVSVKVGGRYWDRTSDLTNVNRAL